MTDLAQLEEELLSPSPALIEDMKTLEGDLLILGVGGKMRPQPGSTGQTGTDRRG